MKDVNGKIIKVGDTLRRLTQYGGDASARMYVGTLHIVEFTDDKYVRVQSDPGNWELPEHWEIVKSKEPAGTHYVINETPSALCSKQAMGIQFGRETAIKSAENLARANPGKTYYVMQAVVSVKAEAPVTITEIV